MKTTSRIVPTIPVGACFDRRHFPDPGYCPGFGASFPG